ncbi:hypothetical protein QTP70_003931 [Hemibagrus guttatus]|uniref:SEFIR domain-containing protein n=1 Tax=Hemibagrus guttatus TaxID=175788 RepID=A0AAE0QW68_9TELE|nr:hypothetical protein QTP70_003931 [Hemibagrus guttatus]
MCNNLMGLSCSVQVSKANCSEQDLVKPRSEAPNPHPDVDLRLKFKADERNETVPVLFLTLKQLSDANIFSLQGMKVHVHEFTTNNSLCVRYSFNNFSWVQRPDFEPWSFVLDQIVIDPGKTYQVSVSNLPKPDVGGHAKLHNLSVPGCERRKFRSLRVCLENDPSTSSHNTTDKSVLETVSVQERSKVLIIYSQDHPMYTEIVLKLCAFLRAKCATEVTLDLLDSTCLSTVGSIQWLDMQRKRLTRTTDKILILCSPGVCAKWDAMCAGRRVMTREDARSPMGDMLTPALSLIIPEFVCAPSFGKYAVAYFSDVCSEKDVPALCHVTIKYQLMKQFEELFFRLLNEEKYKPGRIKHVDGLGRDDYHSCPSGRALRDAIKAFQAYQLTNPNWFEMELVDVDEEVE